MPDVGGSSVPVHLAPLPTLDEQVGRLVALGIPELVGVSESEMRAAIQPAPDGHDSLLAISPDRLPPSALAPLLRHKDKPGFVVTDMVDVDRFAPIAESSPPDALLYLVHGPDRGDDMANWSPDEALPAIIDRGRTPLTLTEGIHWLLQAPDVLTRNHCFMTIGSRLRKADGTLDARTPAVWISNGTGRDGPRTGMHRRSVGAGRGTGTRGWASPQAAAERRSVLRRPPTPEARPRAERPSRSGRGVRPER